MGRAKTMTDIVAAETAVESPALVLRTPAAVDVFSRILTHGPIGRIDVGRQTGLSQAAVTKAVAPLIERGVIVESNTLRPGQSPGRPVYPLDVVPDALLALGIKVSINEVIGVSTDMRAGILDTVHRQIPDHRLDTVLDAVVKVVSELKIYLGTRSARLMGIGVAVSGDVDTEHGVVRHSPLLGWTDVRLGELLTGLLGPGVLIDNDVRALTIAEDWFGVGVDADSFAIVTIGSGIGCGLYLNGDVLAGAYGVAGEIGHLPLASEEFTCTCGRHGCVEAVASSSAILAAIRAGTGSQELTMQHAVDLAHGGDPVAVAAFHRAGSVIGTAIATMVNLTGPSVVLVSGEGVADYDLYEQHLRQSYSEHAFGAAAGCEIVTRSHSFDDWARGAAASVIRATIRQKLTAQAT
jgi:predicted NBD/HSP70 family sugar kinase